MTDPWFDAVQDAHWGSADERHFAWTTLDPGFAPVEDELLAGPLATLEHPCLEIGCGDGTNLARLVRAGSTIGVDRYPAKARFASRAVPEARVAAGDALALPFRDGAFRGVFVRNLLHHVLRPELAVAEAVRVLAPGGTLLVMEPNGANPLVALQARLVPAEAVLRTFRPATVIEALAGQPLVDRQVRMAQGFPLRRLVLHPRYGLPALGRPRAAARALAGLERVLERLTPRSRWSYVIVCARRSTP